MDFTTRVPRNESCIDTVRALHQTIVSLRAALEKSRSEILELKSKNWPDVGVEDTIRNLSIENHVLRQKVVNTNQVIKKETDRRGDKQKIKRKDSTDKLEFKKVQKAKERVQENEDNNVHVLSVSSIPKISKTLGNTANKKKSKNHLSKSKTIYFSNTFEGEKQIATVNSLFINKSASDSQETQEDAGVILLEQKKEKNAIKSKKNIQFDEEIIENLTASRRGSISDFITEEHINDEANQLKQYSECITKSEVLIKKEPQLKTPREIKKSKERTKTKNKFRDKSPITKVFKREETFVKDKPEVLQQKQIDGDFIKEKQSRAIILGEQVEEALKQKYSHKDKPLTVSKESVSIVHEQNEIEIVKVDSEDKELVNEEESDVDFSKCIEPSKETFPIVECDVKQGSEVIDSAEKIILEETKPESYEDNIIESNVNINETCSEKIDNTKEALQPQLCDIDSNQNDKASDITTEGSSVKNNNEILQQNNAEKDSDETINSTNSTESTSSKTQKNVEISVKIYKGCKKPIEIDIQTKKHNKRKKDKRLKMNDKSQNTSFDKEYPEPALNNIENTSCDNVGNILQNDVEQEVDDIELIFTTDDTKETDFKEELVPIDTYAETQLLQCPLSDYDEKLSVETSDRELEDDVFNDNFENENQENCNFQSQTYDFRRENSQIYNSKSDNSINHEDKSFKSYYSYQDSSFENKSLEKDESFDRFEEKVRIIETDISKIGIQDVEYNLSRRNTCPNPIQYRPIIHREALGRGLNSRKCRPIVAHSNVIRKESGAQTDISALPGSSWRSESSLGHKVKVGDHFTTLPSKFPHPGSRLRLSEKTVEARRVLLSDIGFTSMVPELSRSADHLCPPTARGPAVSSYGQFLRTTDLYSPAYTSQKFVWTTTTPSEGSHSQSRYSSQYPLSSPPASRRRCSAPVSPSRKTTALKSTPSRVRFANGSLPELRGDWTATVDSGESTDSLVEEAEHFLRRSIDCLAPCRDVCYRSDTTKITGVRRASAPEPSRDNVPPQGWQPFLPRIPRDLHLDYWVKVISPEGRVRGGRVRYVGPLMNQPESFVGVQLSTPDGHSDGTYNSRRYFNCEPYHGLFVPFKKIIMGWRP